MPLLGLDLLLQQQLLGRLAWAADGPGNAAPRHGLAVLALIDGEGEAGLKGPSLAPQHAPIKHHSAPSQTGAT